MAVNVTTPPDGKDDETEFQIKPLFVSLVDGLVLTDHDGREA